MNKLTRYEATLKQKDHDYKASFTMYDHTRFEIIESTAKRELAHHHEGLDINRGLLCISRIQS